MQICSRLRKERERLKLTQSQLAKACGVSFRAYCDYEIGKTEPKASFFSNLHELGADIMFILTGKKLPDIGGINSDEAEIIKYYRSAPLSVKAAAYGTLTSTSVPSGSTSIITTGSNQRIAGRDYNERK
ncbi:MAG TPA: helix-turn-helix domain-containing protein [Arsenophonus sp.]